MNLEEPVGWMSKFKKIRSESSFVQQGEGGPTALLYYIPDLDSPFGRGLPNAMQPISAQGP